MGEWDLQTEIYVIFVTECNTHFKNKGLKNNFYKVCLTTGENYFNGCENTEALTFWAVTVIDMNWA